MIEVGSGQNLIPLIIIYKMAGENQYLIRFREIVRAKGEICPEAVQWMGSKFQMPVICGR